MKKRQTGICGLLLALALLAGCPVDTSDTGNVPENGGGTGGGGEENGTGGGEHGAPPSAPSLLYGPAVSYDPGAFAPSVTFVFDKAVNGTAAGWEITGDGTATLTAKPAPETIAAFTPGVLETFTLTAANIIDETKALAVTAQVMPVSGVFARPEGDGEAVYTVTWYDDNGATNIVSLLTDEDQNPDTPDAPKGFLVEDADLRNIFNAVYTPNAPGSTDGIEPGKLAAAYTEAVSGAVLRLFKITVGSTAADDRIEIGGEVLPGAAAQPAVDKYHPVVIDVGLPGTPNSGLPVFYIHDRGLGTGGADYVHIRLRVNQGANLVIEADNDAEHASPDGACPYGNLTGGTVEVMGGGALRNGAYRGFPLGQGSVIIARLGSRFATGPESPDPPDPGRLGYDAAWLAGPIGENAALNWDAGDQNGSFIEIRDGGTLAFDANLTLQKSLVLRYDVWFVNSPTLTIDAAAGLVAEDSTYKLYGTFFQTGGQNPARPAAKIVVMAGGAISRSALSPSDSDDFITAADSTITINNRGSAGGAAKADYGRDGISGYCNWALPEP